MKSRKTISVQFMLDYANKQLAQKENEVVTKEFKEGLENYLYQKILYLINLSLKVKYLHKKNMMKQVKF